MSHRGGIKGLASFLNWLYHLSHLSEEEEEEGEEEDGILLIQHILVLFMEKDMREQIKMSGGPFLKKTVSCPNMALWIRTDRNVLLVHM